MCEFSFGSLSSFIFFFFLCPFSFPSNIPHTFFPLLSPRLPLHLCSLIPLFISIIFPASCLSHCGCQFSLLISKTLHLCVVCDLARPPSEGCHMRDSCWHDTQVTPSDEQMSASEAMHLFFVSHAHTHPRSDTHRRTRVSVLYGSKNAYTLFTQSSTSNVLTVPFPLLSLSLPLSLSLTHTHTHTHTNTHPSPLTSCPRCQKHAVCFHCQHVHIPDREPLYTVSAASKPNRSNFHGPDKASLCPSYMSAITYTKTLSVHAPFLQ